MTQLTTRRATIGDVAALAGVSKTTVSRYLAGNVDALAKETYHKIKVAIETLGYHPSRMASALKSGRSYLIGMIIADITNPYSTAILRGAEDECNRCGYSLMVCNTDNDPEKERQYIFTLQSHRIDGLIINTTGRNNDFLRQLNAEDTAVVLVDREIPDLSFDLVSVDNQGAVEEMVLFLLCRGYERIAYFTEPVEGVSTRTDRLYKFKSMLNQRKHASAADTYEVDLSKSTNLLPRLEQFLESAKGQHRAIIAGNSVMLLQISLALHTLGLQVPQDVALLGFDNPDWAPLVGPGITVIAQPTYEIGVTAMQRVLYRLQENQEETRHIRLPVELIVRGSTPKV
jgi:LacI family transcriptional regulator, kdg operon repressor